MNQVLIVSDNPIANNAIEVALRNVHLGIVMIGMLAMFGGASYLARKYQFILLVMDADCRRRFGALMDEMSNMIKNCAQQVPLYMVFEGDANYAAASWLPYARKVYENISTPQALAAVTRELVMLQTLHHDAAVQKD